MSFSVMSISSSSKGNSYLIRNDEISILLDLGVSFKKIKDCLKFKDVDLDSINAVFITHEHIDHVKSIKMVLKNMKNAEIYMSEGTLRGIKSNFEDIYTDLIVHSDRLNIIKASELIDIYGIVVKPFNVSHDTNEPLMYNFRFLDKNLSIVTDTGIVTSEIFDSIKDSNTLIIESNHEPDILMFGTYPYLTKKRILSDYGHLSNEACGECLTKILKLGNRPNVFLAHLSEHNNTPEQALLTVRNYLEEEGYLVGRDINIETLDKEEMSREISI